MEMIKKILSKIFTKRYGIYHLRWQISGIVMYPVLGFLALYHLPLWLGVVIAQFIGAIIFYSIDSYVFKEHKEDTLESKLDDIIL